MITNKFSLFLVIIGTALMGVFLGLLIFHGNYFYAIPICVGAIAITWAAALDIGDYMFRKKTYWIVTAVFIVIAILASILEWDKDNAEPLRVQDYQRCRVCRVQYGSEDSPGDFKNIVRTGMCNDCWLRYT